MPPVYRSERGRIMKDGKESLVWRTTERLDVSSPLTGIGDHDLKVRSIHLAVLSAIYQLEKLGISLRIPVVTVVTANHAEPIDIRTSDGARLLIEYYCRRFGCEVDFDFGLISKAGWSASLTIDCERMGYGSGNSRETARADSYVAAARTLVHYCPELMEELSSERSFH
ncbi:unnamed protein product [Cyclocybe aegerita]|uniref:Uncharacterized protein n=1 Tax=Cyclocybe aegerita TaxID=1973307 RepID=A0A8S0WTS2_CYCAE|nr:unnamed protein product [Cyclocybe aegerita]